MIIIVDTHQHFWNYGTYQSSWMEAPPYAGDPVYQHSDARFTLTIFCRAQSGRRRLYDYGRGGGRNGRK
jgi:predicted TIM-barrel fold metal-dependent hydrolase